MKNMKFKLIVGMFGLALTAILQEPALCEELKPISQSVADKHNYNGVVIWWTTVCMTVMGKSLLAAQGLALKNPPISVFIFFIALLEWHIANDIKRGLIVPSSSLETIKCTPELKELIDQIPVGEGLRVPIIIFKTSNNTVVELITIPGVEEGASTVLTVFTILP